jgi:uncharacterized protein
VHVVLAGASGLIGTALVASLRRDGHDVVVLVRRTAAHRSESRWAPERGEVDASALASADAVVCLSGAGVADKRWSPAYKRTLTTSRVDSVGTLATAMADGAGPGVLVCASAVGYYGDTGDVVVDESTPRGAGFLAELCERWEAAAAPAHEAGIRVAHLRTGIVLCADGGMLKRLKPIALLGVAGKLGSGRQYLPWISLADEIAAIRYVLDGDLAGPVNLTGPDPVTNAEFMAALGRAVHRPTVIPTPGFALRLVLGELASDALTGQRAVPRRLIESGFEHRHADVGSALRWALAR